MTDPQQFDVFLCYNNLDQPAVIDLAVKLQAEGLKPWLDVWALRPGIPWQPELEKQIENIKAAAVCIGNSGLGPWQRQELGGFLRSFANRQCPVIPVLLADAPKVPDLPVFLQAMTWVDFRPDMSPYKDPMVNLIWGITGNNQEPMLSSSSRLSLPETYEYEKNKKTCTFVHVSDKVWKEKDEFGREFNTFKEIERDSNFIIIYDVSRDMKIKIPIEGGRLLITWTESEWVDKQYFYVTKKLAPFTKPQK